MVDADDGNRWRCPACYEVAHESGFCNDCGMELVPLCPADHKCTCADSVKTGAAYCPECNKPVCPVCGSHDVQIVSRVTGYLSSVEGWNEAKRQELRDRVRVTVENGILIT